ncbi:MAG: hypothetical protein IPJ20_05645 [Flammeovirgaceae bacterium]|nr:hypothetical protein [Flammeovirgaceae bacterium]
MIKLRNLIWVAFAPLSFYSCLFLFSCSSPKNESQSADSTPVDQLNMATTEAPAEAPAAEAPQTENKLLKGTEEVVLDGYIGDHYDILLLLREVTSGQFEGKYLYKRVNKFISLKGHLENNTMLLSESNDKGEITGQFTCDVSSYPRMEGSWTKPDGSGSMNLYLHKIIPVGIENSNGQFEFGKKSKDDKGEVLYNLNGIFTTYYLRDEGDGWSSGAYKCLNLKTGTPLKFEDIFKPESKGQIMEMIATKVKEICGQQVGENYSAADYMLDDQSTLVTREGIRFISPCERSHGYYHGVFTVDFTFDDVGNYLKHSY